MRRRTGRSSGGLAWPSWPGGRCWRDWCGRVPPHVDAAAERAHRLGAALLHRNERWHTLADPAGHPFDLCLNPDDPRTTLMGVMLDCPDANGTFTVRLLVPGPVLGGRSLTRFEGRWLVRDGLVLTAIAVPARRELCHRLWLAWRPLPAQPATFMRVAGDGGHQAPTAVSPIRPRTGNLTPQHRDLMPQHKDLRVLGGITARQEHQPANTRTMNR